MKHRPVQPPAIRSEDFLTLAKAIDAYVPKPGCDRFIAYYPVGHGAAIEVEGIGRLEPGEERSVWLTPEQVKDLRRSVLKLLPTEELP